MRAMLHFRAVAVGLAVLVLAFAGDVQVRHSVLEHAKRADDGAIDPSEDQGQEDEADDDGHIEGHHGGQELDLRHPAEPSVKRSGEVQEQQRDAQPEDDGQRDAYFPKHLTFYCFYDIVVGPVQRGRPPIVEDDPIRGPMEPFGLDGQ